MTGRAALRSSLLFLALMAAVPLAAAAQAPPEARDIAARCQGAARISHVEASGGLDDAAALREAIDQTARDLAAGKVARAEIVLDAGATYRLRGQIDNNDAIAIRSTDAAVPEIRCLTLNGNGATLLLAAGSRGFYLGGCRDCILENFTMRSDPPFGAQGILAGSGKSEGYDYADVNLAPAFPPRPQFDYATTHDRISGIPLTAVFRRYSAGAIPHRLDFRIDAGPPWNLEPYARIDHARLLGAVAGEGEHIVRLFFDPRARNAPRTARKLSLLHAGATLVVFKANYPAEASKRQGIDAAIRRGLTSDYARRNPSFASPEHFAGSPSAVIFAEANADLLLHNITLSDLEGMGFHLRGNRGKVTIDGVHVVPLGPGYLLSVGSDAVHMVNNRAGLTIRNSVFEDNADDMLNLSSEPLWLTGAAAGEAMVRTTVPVPVFAGDRFLALDADGREVARFSATRVTAFVPGPYGGTSYRIAFGGAPPLSPTNLLIDLDASNTRPMIERNQFIDAMRNGIIIRGGGTIRDNRFVNLALTAVAHGTEDESSSPPRGKWGDFGPLTVTGNIVIDALDGLLTEGQGSRLAQPHAGLALSGNQVMGVMNFAAKRVDPLLTDPAVAEGNEIYLPDDDPRTRDCDPACLKSRFVHEPDWSGGGFAVTTLPAGAVQAKKTAASPLSALDPGVAARLFGLPRP